MMAFGGEQLLNLIILKLYNTRPNRFRGNGTASAINYTYAVVNVPTCRLVVNDATHNFEINLDVRVTADPLGINFDSVLPMKSLGTISISDGILSITRLNLTNNSVNPIKQIVVNIINSQVIPPLTATLLSIPLPQLSSFFGTGLSASISSGQVINGPAIEIGSRIVGRIGVAVANVPPLAELQALNNGANANTATSIALVSDEAVNILIRNIFTDRSLNFDERGSKAGFGAGIKGRVHATTPRLQIVGGIATITTTISLSHLEGGIRVPIWGWSWVDLPTPPNVTVQVNHTLSTSGNRAIITITGIDRISVNLNFPSILSPVESVLESLINAVLRSFRGLLGDAIEGTRFEIFRLPSNILGNNLNVNLSFEQGGLRYFQHSIKAIFRVSI